jgi:hypothetical protein
MAKQCIGDKQPQPMWHVSHIIITDVTTNTK